MQGEQGKTGVRPHRDAVPRFLLVGCMAAAVHWAVVVALVEGAALPPLVANVGGWMVALGVSFFGHHRLSFRGHGGNLRSAAWRFSAVSATGFLINETAYWAMLRWSGSRYDLALALVLVAVAGLTYALSRHWAFRHSARQH